MPEREILQAYSVRQQQERMKRNILESGSFFSGLKSLNNNFLTMYSNAFESDYKMSSDPKTPEEKKAHKTNIFINALKHTGDFKNLSGEQQKQVVKFIETEMSNDRFDFGKDIPKSTNDLIIMANKALKIKAPEIDISNCRIELSQNGYVLDSSKATNLNFSAPNELARSLEVSVINVFEGNRSNTVTHKLTGEDAVLFLDRLTYLNKKVQKLENEINNSSKNLDKNIKSFESAQRKIKNLLKEPQLELTNFKNNINEKVNDSLLNRDTSKFEKRVAKINGQSRDL